MAKVRLTHDEWYPMVEECGDDEHWHEEYDVPDDVLAEFREARDRFEAAHSKLIKIYTAENERRYRAAQALKK